ncbi:MAG: hypothetical protein ACI38A_02350 [Candidatus Ornithomonoglobus sp.]
MIKHKKIFIILLSAFFIGLPVGAFAAEPAPDKGFGRIPWAVKCCGAMPNGMTAGFVILAVVIALTVLYGIKIKGDKRNEK